MPRERRPSQSQPVYNRGDVAGVLGCGADVGRAAAGRRAVLRCRAAAGLCSATLGAWARANRDQRVRGMLLIAPRVRRGRRFASAVVF